MIFSLQKNELVTTLLTVKKDYATYKSAIPPWIKIISCLPSCFIPPNQFKMWGQYLWWHLFVRFDNHPEIYMMFQFFLDATNTVADFIVPLCFLYKNLITFSLRKGGRKNDINMSFSRRFEALSLKVSIPFCFLLLQTLSQVIMCTHLYIYLNTLLTPDSSNNALYLT